MLAAVKAEDGEALVRLNTDTLANFEHDRVAILNPALLMHPRSLRLESPESDSSDASAFVELDDEPGLDDPADVSEADKDLIFIDDLEDFSEPKPAKVTAVTPSKPSARKVPLIAKPLPISKGNKRADVVQKRKI